MNLSEASHCTAPQTIASQIKHRIGSFHPEVAIILGSGLGNFGEEINDKIIIPYSEIEGFPTSTVSGHQGRLIIGHLDGKDVLCMQGRIHLYEGHQPQAINTIIKAFKLIGIEHLIVTNAAGSLHQEMPAGSLMLIKDHINLNIPSPLVGPNDEQSGPRFPDMSDAYSLQIREHIKNISTKLNLKLFEGVYIMALGPCFETPAEIRAFQVLGADAVGMSTVPEVISAIHSGMKVLGLSVITNLGTGLSNKPQSHTETLEQANKASENLTKLIRTYLQES